MTIEDQPGFDPRLAWASEGGALLARVCPVLVVVDILRFTTAVDVAVASDAQVVPARWPVREGPGRAGPDRYSLSPVSLLGVPAGAGLAERGHREPGRGCRRGGGAGRVPA